VRKKWSGVRERREKEGKVNTLLVDGGLCLCEET
jgi:hypothetical protein